MHAHTHTRTHMHARTKNIIVKWIQAMHHFCDSSLLAGTMALPWPQIWVETDQRWKVTYLWLRMRLWWNSAPHCKTLCTNTVPQSLVQYCIVYVVHHLYQNQTDSKSNCNSNISSWLGDGYICTPVSLMQMMGLTVLIFAERYWKWKRNYCFWALGSHSL